jgi:hypothetical protein
VATGLKGTNSSYSRNRSIYQYVIYMYCKKDGKRTLYAKKIEYRCKHKRVCLLWFK